MSQFNRNVLSIEIDGDSYGTSYAIHRRNIAGICYLKTLESGYSLVIHLIKPLQYNQNHDGTKSSIIWTLAVPNVSYEDYECYLDWFNNSKKCEIERNI